MSPCHIPVITGIDYLPTPLEHAPSAPQHLSPSSYLLTDARTLLLLNQLPLRWAIPTRSIHPLLLNSHNRILPIHSSIQRSFQLRTQRQLAQHLALLFRRHVALRRKFLVLEFRQAFSYDVYFAVDTVREGGHD